MSASPVVKVSFKLVCQTVSNRRSITGRIKSFVLNITLSFAPFSVTIYLEALF